MDLKAYADLDLDQLETAIEKLDDKESRKFIKALGREMALADLWFLNYNILNHTFFSKRIHKPLCHFITLPDKLKMILWPRMHGKTTLATVSNCVHILLKDPNARILILSGTEDLAIDMLRTVKGHFYDNARLKMLFPEYCAKDLKELGSKYYLDLPNKTDITKEHSIQAAGLETTLTSKHFTHIIMDDLVTDNNSSSKDQCDKIIDAFKKLTFFKELDCKTWICGTRYSSFDLYGYLLKEDPSMLSNVKSAIDEDTNEILWKERYTLDMLDDIKRKSGNYLYYCQMQNKPINPEDMLFDVNKIKYVDQLPGLVNIYQMVDPAISQKDTADYTAIVTAAVDKDWNIYFIDIERKRMNSADTIDTIISLYQRFSPRLVSVETNQYQVALEEGLRKRMKELNLHIPVQGVKRGQNDNKFQRINALINPLEYGELYILEKCRGKQFLIDEMAMYSQKYRGHDDVLDAASDIIRIGATPMNAIPQRQRPAHNTFEHAARDILMNQGVDNQDELLHFSQIYPDEDFELNEERYQYVV